jgi:hypothetical protein
MTVVVILMILEKSLFVSSVLNLSFFGPVVIFKITPPYFYIFNYLPFEENLALYLNKFEFPSPKDDVYQV